MSEEMPDHETPAADRPPEADDSPQTDGSSQAGGPGQAGDPPRDGGPEAADGPPELSEAEREQLEQQMSEVRVEDLLTQTVASVLNLSARRIVKEDEVDLEQARIGIEAVRAIVALLPPEVEAAVREPLSQVQVLYAQRSGTAPPTDAGAPGSTPGTEAPGSTPGQAPGPGGQPGPGGEQPGQGGQPGPGGPDSPGGSRLWTPGGN